MQHRTPRQEYSDARYLVILFGLISVVLMFVFLMYFIYGQKQFSTLPWAIDTTDPASQSPTLEQVRNGTVPTTTTPSNSPTTTLPVATTPNPNADVSRYNPREAETLTLRGRSLLDAYFGAIQKGEYRTACSLLSNTICNARRDIFAFSQFLEKTSGGYQVKNVTLAQEQKPTEAIYCVEYTYTLKADLNPQPVTEYFQYRIQTRPDGGEEISARVCEKIIKDGRERPCPIITPKKYCF